MSEKIEMPTTQRAYTLRLRGAPADKHAWRDALWATHEAVNKGARIFGDWILTLRGGIDHRLANDKAARILLCLSWMSVEDEHGAPPEFIVAYGDECKTKQNNQDARNKLVLDALDAILRARGLQPAEVESWLTDCRDSLCAAIRGDAVWVNRSSAFEAARKLVGDSLTRDEIWDLLAHFFGAESAYLSMPKPEDKGVAAEGGTEEKAKDLVQKAGKWLSNRFGTGKGADFTRMAKVYEAIVAWVADQNGVSHSSGPLAIASLAASLRAFALPSDDAAGVLKLISGPGYKSATRNIINTWSEFPDTITSDHLKKLAESAAGDSEKCKTNTGGKGRRIWSDTILAKVQEACGFGYLQTDGPARHTEFSVMLDHAARHVSIVHSWIKLAEQRRREFEKGAKKLPDLRQRAIAAAAWLEQFCEKRSTSLGATAGGGYRIRKRAIEGWDEIIKVWSRPSCKNEDDRVGAARDAQADPEIDKFGDIQLFEALAADDAMCVWKGHDGTPDTSILKDFESGTTAEHDRRRFKVPAYRHPDPIRHPIFCDFGNSRWDIQFAIHMAGKAAKNGQRKAREGNTWIDDRHALRMGLWNGQGVGTVDLRWSCKRLAADLAFNQSSVDDAVEVTRADRLGRAASDAPANALILNIFDEECWNGRLQAPRAQLNRIASLLDRGKVRQAEILRQRLHWLISFSPRLQLAGPFIDYASRFIDDAPAKPFVSRNGEYAVKHAANEGREGHAKLILSRLPGMRVLSVDLGHRFAAACAVWEALSLETFRKETTGLKVLGGGQGSNHLFLHVEKPGTDGKTRTVIYRRVGTDTLPDGKPHPAPWAKLDRQFLIKLQGEEAPARKAASHEVDLVRRWEESVGRVRDASSTLPCRVDALMSESVTALTRALRRHGDRARIAFNLSAGVKFTPGGGSQPLDREGRIALLTQAILLWHGLFNGKRWSDPWAFEEWKKHGLPEIAAAQETEDITGPARRAQRQALEDLLKPHVERLADLDLSEWSVAWKTRWQRDDANWSAKHGILRALKRWIAPRGLRTLTKDSETTKARKKAARVAARHVGGLSVDRINTFSGLYQLLKAFKMRPEPDDPRKNIPKKGDDELSNYHRRLLDVRDAVREQRVKQIASRIVEAALGVGRITIPEKGNQPKRPRTRKDAPCHAVVIESLTHYRPDDLRTRRENRMLMQWSSSKVQKFLKEGCQLYGLHLREVPANYTSRQDSRTALPGERCDDVLVEEFLTAPWWNKAVNAAQRKIDEKGSTDAEAQFLVDLRKKCEKMPQTERTRKTVRVRRPGGDLFVAAPVRLESNGHCTYRALQADLNAAANIGVRALLDPDFAGKWWYVPCSEADAMPVAEKIKGSACFASPTVGFGSLRKPEQTHEGHATPKTAKKRTRKNGAEIANFWTDPSAEPLRNSIDGGFWLSTPAYWAWVRKRAIQVLREINGLSQADVTIDTPW